MSVLWAFDSVCGCDQLKPVELRDGLKPLTSPHLTLNGFSDKPSNCSFVVKTVKMKENYYKVSDPSFRSASELRALGLDTGHD